eukprot:CAMPEP_0206262004 /NCGR_PEP_ID=MMETSP0047_2-20121206/27979_1 /ASSEMBLY_ACC=CAM_ASM_000192 /TAXON_ID=195065 /ORGANISM="Chroomonas mesostigmatica_cf, Strain CCMP1168" /LENGTH=54 /DNA_ID=CAMNT_0053689301 /DNA_START=18 /DNA_END=180 /DNA_ORIENTATION=+
MAAAASAEAYSYLDACGGDGWLLQGERQGHQESPQEVATDQAQTTLRTQPSARP